MSLAALLNALSAKLESEAARKLSAATANDKEEKSDYEEDCYEAVAEKSGNEAAIVKPVELNLSGHTIDKITTDALINLLQKNPSINCLHLSHCKFVVLYARVTLYRKAKEANKNLLITFDTDSSFGMDFLFWVNQRLLNTQLRPLLDWQKVAFLIAFVRANRQHPFRDSGLALLKLDKQVLKFAQFPPPHTQETRFDDWEGLEAHKDKIIAEVSNKEIIDLSANALRSMIERFNRGPTFVFGGGAAFFHPPRAVREDLPPQRPRRRQLLSNNPPDGIDQYHLPPLPFQQASVVYAESVQRASVIHTRFLQRASIVHAVMRQFVPK